MAKKDLRKEIVKALEDKEDKIICAECSMCGNVSSYDKGSLKGSTWRINGIKNVLCCPCEDELLVKLAKARNIKIKLGDGGEVIDVKWNL